MRLFRLMALMFIAVMLVTGCGAAREASAGAGEDGRIVVAASFSTMADFARKIGGERVNVSVVVPAGSEPHDWEPSAQDIARLEQAELLVINGAGLEHWVDAVTSALEHAPVIVDTAAEAMLATGNSLDGGDPHIWLNPLYAKAQLAAIRDAMTAADPEGAEYYDANYGEYAALMDELDKEYRETLAPLPNRDIVVAHEAFGYLCAAYGLRQVSARGLSPDGEPDPAKMAEVIDYSRANRVKVVFFERRTSPEVAEAIAREIGAETAVLNPIESLDEDEDYISVMRENLNQLKAALE